MAQPNPRLSPPEALIEPGRPATSQVTALQRWTPPALPTDPLVRVSWARYAAALRRYKWLMAGVVLLGAAVGFAVTRMMAPEYEVHSTLWISTDAPEDRDRAGPIRAGESMRQTSWPDLLTSFAILERVVRKMSLHLLPAKPSDTAVFAGFDTDARFLPATYELKVDQGGRRYRLTTADGTQLETGSVGDSVGRRLGFRWRPSPTALGPGRTVKFALLTPREAALALKSSLTITFSRESNLLGLTLKGTDPQRVTAVMTVLLDEFIAAAAELKKRNVSAVAKVLKQQLDYAERDLKGAEAALESFRVQTITLPSENTTTIAAAPGGAERPGGTVFQNFFTRQIEYDNIRRDRQALENTLSAVEAGTLEASALWSIPTVESNAPLDLKDKLAELSAKQTALQAARRTYTDDHTTVRDLNQEVEELKTRTIPRLVGGLVAELKRREQDLGSQVQTTAQQLRSIPTRTTEETRLRRNVEARGALYATLKNRYEEATLAEASTVPDVQVLDAPVAPERPRRDRAPFIILLAVLVSVAAALGLALLLDRFDRRFRYAEQATNELGLDVIGAVPPLTDSTGRNPEEAAQLLEAFRAIRLNLTHAFDISDRVSLTVSSPGPGDGKSLVSSNLALSFAEAGCRTLLVDGDLRRGELHSRFDVERRPGLLEYLAGDVTLDEVLRPSGYENLTLMPRGTSHQRAPELLMSPRMSDLMTELERRYHAIVVDSPPLGASIDPFVLGTVTGSVLLVLRSGETDRRIAEAKLKLLDRLPIRLLGVVLNDIRGEGSYPYYAYLHTDLPEGDGGAPQFESQVAAFARRTGLAALRER
jgi:succinoglycan biosynthesis transport protein ExoP